MAVGVPAMVVDYGGPSELVSEETGWKIALGSRAQIVERFCQALESIVANPGVIDEKGAKAVSRVRSSFTWEAKAREVVRIYSLAVKRGGANCDRVTVN